MCFPKRFVRIRHFGFMANYQRSHFVRTRPPAVANGATPSFTRNRFANFVADVSYLSDAIDCHREIDGSSDCLEIPFEMLCRYVLANIPNRPDDVLLHADGHVCLSCGRPFIFASQPSAALPQLTSKHTTPLSSPPSFRSCQVFSSDHINPHSPTFSIA